MNRLVAMFGMVCLFSALAFSQIPNAGFENWTNGEPDGWYTSNVPPAIITVTQSSDSKSGTSSLKGIAKSVLTATAPPIIVVGTEEIPGFAVNQRYLAFRGFYKFAPVSSDVFSATVAFLKNGQAIGGGAMQLPAASQWTAFEIPLIIISLDVPDTCVITMSVTGSGGQVNAGSTFYVDDLSLALTTDINEVSLNKEFALNQNYPNPFNPSTVISYSIPVSEFVTLKIYDVLGNEVKTIVNEQKEAGKYQVEFNASGLTNGIYLYKLQAGEFTSVKKLTVLK